MSQFELVRILHALCYPTTVGLYDERSEFGRSGAVPDASYRIIRTLDLGLLPRLRFDVSKTYGLTFFLYAIATRTEQDGTECVTVLRVKPCAFSASTRNWEYGQVPKNKQRHGLRKEDKLKKNPEGICEGPGPGGKANNPIPKQRPWSSCRMPGWSSFIWLHRSQYGDDADVRKAYLLVTSSTSPNARMEVRRKRAYCNSLWKGKKPQDEVQERN
ncbi:hypothetical protein BGY98DRAFT_1174688 [Russula aff. rugulosa BPL654]|nr:hypothetical protein BGY98DRAFT_1174688 [Russula aff. rugulosa BPL654]